MHTRLIQVIALILYAISDWKMVVVVVEGKCTAGQYCNIKDCSVVPAFTDDENKMDKACQSNKCNYIEPHSQGFRRCQQRPGSCIEGKFCGPNCDILPVPEIPRNIYCESGFNCDKITLRCVKKPPPAKCKAGEYCHRADCWENPLLVDNTACESNKCNKDFICEEVEEEDDGVPNQNQNEKEEEEESKKYWIILAVVVLILYGILTFLIWFYCCHKKETMNNTPVNEKEEGKKFHKRNSSKVSSKSKKSAVSNIT